MIPRVIVQFSHPHSPLMKGDILTLSGTFYLDEHCVLEVSVSEVFNYPHLFAPLPWYSHRAIDDMPEYIKPKDDNSKIHKVKWEKDDLSISGWCLSVDIPDYWIDACFDNIDIATEAEYTSFISDFFKLTH